MREIIKLFLIVAIFSAVAGLALAYVQDATKEQIEQQEIKYVKGPAIKALFEGCTNDPMTDRKKLKDGDKEIDIFIGEFDGKKDVIAFEAHGKGYDGDIGVLVGFDLRTDELLGMRVTTQTETPGVGARSTTDTAFISQFKGMSVDTGFKVKADGGDIDAISGATITSRGVGAAIESSVDTYKRLKDEIIKTIQG